MINISAEITIKLTSPLVYSNVNRFDRNLLNNINYGLDELFLHITDKPLTVLVAFYFAFLTNFNSLSKYCFFSINGLAYTTCQ